MEKEPDCCQHKFVWLVMALCALLAAVLLLGY
jgi:hypothetical protein